MSYSMHFLKIKFILRSPTGIETMNMFSHNNFNKYDRNDMFHQKQSLALVVRAPYSANMFAYHAPIFEVRQT
jgi:hypothetical protein